MKILITGASGYIGNRLAHVLADKGHQVHAFVRSSNSVALLRHPNITVFEGDVLDKTALAIAMKGCRQVYHTAGFVRLWAKDPSVFYKQNVGGTCNVLDVALSEGVNKLVYTSSCGVWGPCDDHLLIENDPRTESFDNDYDLSKFLAERSVKEYGSKGLFTVIVNPPRVYGPGVLRHSSAVNRFILQLLNNRIAILPWQLGVKANYAFIDDVVRGHILAMEKGLGGERYILGGENVSYQRFVDTVRRVAHPKTIYLRFPPFLLRTVARVELIRGKLNDHDPFITPNAARRFQSDKIFDCGKAIRQLGYSVTPFDEGMSITIKHLKNKAHGQL